MQDRRSTTLDDSSPRVWNVPYHSNPYFTGRELLLAEMHAALTSLEAGSKRVALTGLGGIGKTQTAVEYAYQQRADYDLVWWVRGEHPATLSGDYAALASQPLLAADLGLAEDAPQEAAVAAVRTWLERHRRWLLVIDNVNDPRVAADLLPRSATGHVVLTSQAETGWDLLANPLPLEVLAPADAARLLLARAREAGPPAESAAIALAAALGGLPLALEQAAAYIAVSGTVNLASYADLFATRALELLERGQPPGYQHTVATTWSLALQTLESSEPAAVALLTLAAFLAPDDLPQQLLANPDGGLPEPLAATARDPLALGDAVAALRRYSLLRVLGDGLFVHRLLQTVVRAGLDTKTKRTWSAAAVRLVDAGFPALSQEVASWPQCQRLLAHALTAVDHGQQLGIGFEMWGWLLNQTALYLRSRGQFRQAKMLFQRLVASSEQTQGPDHPDTLVLINNLAAIHADLGDLQGARKLEQQVLSTRRRVLGHDHPDTLTSMNNLAQTLVDLGDLQGANQLHEQSVSDLRRRLGDDHPVTLRAMNNLADTRRELGNLQGARELQEETLARRQRVLGEDHPDTLSSINNLALVRQALGDVQEARQLHEQTLAALRRVLGDDHPDTLNSMNNLATTRRILGDLQGAHELLEQAVAGYGRVLGHDHPVTLITRRNLAQVRRELERLQA